VWLHLIFHEVKRATRASKQGTQGDSKPPNKQACLPACPVKTAHQNSMRLQQKRFWAAGTLRGQNGAAQGHLEKRVAEAASRLKKDKEGITVLATHSRRRSRARPASRPSPSKTAPPRPPATSHRCCGITAERIANLCHPSENGANDCGCAASSTAWMR